jgi:hypothetical protein
MIAGCCGLLDGFSAAAFCPMSANRTTTAAKNNDVRISFGRALIRFSWTRFGK